MDRAITLRRRRHTKGAKFLRLSSMLGAGILPGKNSRISYLRRRDVQEYNDTLTALTTGTRLAGRLDKGALAPDQVLKYGIDICEGLEIAHHVVSTY